MAEELYLRSNNLGSNIIEDIDFDIKSARIIIGTVSAENLEFIMTEINGLLLSKGFFVLPSEDKE